MRMTLEQIRQKGMEVLRRELGRSGFIRFMQQFETGSGNYAKERHAWVDSMTSEQLRQLADEGKKPKRKRKS